MRLSRWRPAIKAWVESNVNVASFQLREPTAYNEWVCTLPPLGNIGLAEGNAFKATALQDIYFTIRHSAATPFIELPLAAMEGFLSSLQLAISQAYGSIADLQRLEVLTVDNPVRVREYGDGDADWLITLVLSLEIEWSPELEPSVALPPLPNITGIEHGLFKERLEPKAPYLFPPESHKDPTNRDKFGTLNTRINS